ncbi:hypothetical protein CORC01_06159, partial [Colletotrichum orchidophilum]
ATARADLLDLRLAPSKLTHPLTLWGALPTRREIAPSRPFKYTLPTSATLARLSRLLPCCVGPTPADPRHLPSPSSRSRKYLLHFGSLPASIFSAQQQHQR